MRVSLFPLLIFAGVAGAAIFFFAPSGGRRRRALFRDKVGKLARRSARAVVGGAHDLSNRAAGKAAGLRTSLVEEPVDDVILEERVRARLGHAVEHAHAITVTAKNGFVMLQGTVQDGEINDAINAVEGVPGVYAVENCLETSSPSTGDTPNSLVSRTTLESAESEGPAETTRAEPVGTVHRSHGATGPTAEGLG